METTRNPLPPFAQKFFQRLEEYIDAKVYYFGSIQRLDYFPGYSDIDADIFTDNEGQTIALLGNFLNKQKSEFHRFAYNLHRSNRLVYGYKIVYSDPDNQFSTEMSIYNKNIQEAVQEEHNFKSVLPIHVTMILIILKYFYYVWGILPSSLYLPCKKFVMGTLVEGKDSEFVLVDIPPPASDT